MIQVIIVKQNQRSGCGVDRVKIDWTHSRGQISRELYGHFSEQIGGVFYDGLWVGEDSPVENIRGFRKSLVDSFKKIAPPVLRWPGGCFAETYDWRDGIGPREKRPRRVNWWYGCDQRTESNQVGTHEFMDFCRMVGAEPYLAANMTSLPALHIRNWMEYCNFPAGETTLADERAKNGDPAPFNVRYWGIGNENWGGGGQMTPEMCAREFIRFSTIARPLGQKDMRLIMCGANGHDLEWTRRLMKEWAARRWHEMPTWGLSVHYYTTASAGKDDVIFDENGWYDTLFRADYMRRIVDDHRLVMDECDPERKIKLVIDEWGIWHKDGTGPSRGYNLFEQQSNMRDAAAAALTLNLFNNRCDLVGMANVAQLCNNLHSLYLASGEHFVETPNYHVFRLFMDHQGAKQLQTEVYADSLEKPGYDSLCTLSASASRKENTLTLTLANLSLTEGKEICLDGLEGKVKGPSRLTLLFSDDPNACNTFENPAAVVPREREIILGAQPVLFLPAASVAKLSVPLTEE